MDLTSFLLSILLDLSIYLMLVTSLNFEVGLTGIPNLGRVLAVTAGAFVTGTIPVRILMNIYGISGDPISSNTIIVSLINSKLTNDTFMGIIILVITIVIAIIIGGALGYISSYPALRLKEVYLAIMLLIAGTALVIIGINYPALVGGTSGVEIPSIYSSIFGSGKDFYLKVAIFHLIVSGFMVFLFYNISHSPIGRVMKAIRENETLIITLGRDVKTIRGRVMALGGALASVTGVLYTFYVGTVYAGNFDNINWGFYPYLILILGGAGTTLGSIISTLIFIASYHLLDLYKDILGNVLHFDPIWLHYILFGLILMIVIIYRPQGLIKERNRPLLELRKQ
jgi:branched-chain amino acid transport system permease protein